jgi:Ca2+:H+ antiporter
VRIAGRDISWTAVAPPLAVVVLAATWGRDLPAVPAALVSLVLVAAVLAAVHHAEVVALRVGEPLGSLVLAVAVTVIEVGLILTLTAAGGPGSASLARDTVFAAVMITCNGILGLSLFIGAVRYRLAVFNPEGSGAALATVATLATLCLVLYGAFVSTQTVRHRDFFLPVASDGSVLDDDTHADPPSRRGAVISLVQLLIALVAVVGLAKVLSPTIEAGVATAGLPPSFVGVVIALLVLAPETLAAANAAGRGRIQVSLNLAFGSAMASIGLTIPAVAVASIWLEGPLVLGLGATQTVLLAITVVVGALTVVPGRATRLQGVVHLVLLAAFVFLAANP